VDYSPYPGHDGLDYGVSVGAVVRAMHAGRIARTPQAAYAAYGAHCWVEGKDCYERTMWSLYGHLSRILADEGEEVQAGNIIALSGNTGRSTGPHLHVGVEVQVENAGYRDAHDRAYFWHDPYPMMT
jgi:murein DD-endopeptidase MepM/ murein hydrolase activator NlpD